MGTAAHGFRASGARQGFLSSVPNFKFSKDLSHPLSVTIHNSDWTSRLRSFAPPDGRGRLSLHELCYAQPRICAPLQFSG